MAHLLVETKLLVPRPRRELVALPRLVDVVRRARHAALTLVSAPAGFGKTTLLAAAVDPRADDEQRAIAWVSLDSRDGDASQFWSYVLTRWTLRVRAPPPRHWDCSTREGPCSRKSSPTRSTS